MDDILGKLFGNPARVKIMRLFLFSPDAVFETADVRTKSHVPRGGVIGELNRLRAMRFIKRKSGTKEVPQKRSGKLTMRKKHINGWVLNHGFPYLDALQSLLLSSKSFRRETIAKRFSGTGRVKLLIISGIFIKNDDSRIDVLIVGDYLRRRLIINAVKALEAEIGKELRYAIFETNDFIYRLGVYDKFVRDIVDYPHEKLINKIGVHA